jgi:hypothetical protein
MPPTAQIRVKYSYPVTKEVYCDCIRQNYSYSQRLATLTLLAYSQSVTLRSDNDSKIPRVVTNNSNNCSNVQKAITERSDNATNFPVAIMVQSHNWYTYGQSDNGSKR